MWDFNMACVMGSFQRTVKALVKKKLVKAGKASSALLT